MKKKLVLVTLMIEAKEKYLKDLKTFFGDCIDIEAYSINETIDEKIVCDLLLLTRPSLLPYLKPFAKGVEIIYVTRALLRDNIGKIINLPRGTKTMMVDYDYESCVNMISILNEVGIKDIDFIPVYPGMKPGEVPNVELAVTAGLLDYIPKGINNIIDIGWTVVDMSTMMDIAVRLNVFNDSIADRLIEYSYKIMTVSRSLILTLRSSMALKNRHGIVLDVIDDGVIVVDNDDNIIQFNKPVSKMLKISQKDLFKKQELLRDKIGSKIIDEKNIENELIKVNETNSSLVVNKRPIIVYKIQYGFIYIIKDVTKILDLENKLRKQLSDKGYIAKYKFENIYGGCPVMQECIKNAKRIAEIDITVLITGESGTGKELFAQSIHNASARKQAPFVAINCAALPSTLLESELFGYEDGAFTDAKKGGKMGLFEQAHKGTIFLDEIGDVPLNIQVKLLRILQEKEVMRIGGTNIIPVDVRVIAATNQDLNILVERGVFRLDLYYRLNVVPLHIPPLRERKSDIPQLIKEMLQRMGFISKKVDDYLMTLLINYQWKGNVRELINCIQYMAYMGSDILTVKDLPPNINLTVMEESSPEKGQPELNLLPWELDVAKGIVSVLRIRNGGRRLIGKTLEARGLKASEYEIRRIIKILQDGGYLENRKGRKGAWLTTKGLELGI